MEKCKEQSFEDFLKDWHIELFPEILDDDLPDHFDNWLGSLDGDDYIKYAEIYGKEQRIVGAQRSLEHFKTGNELIMSAFK